MLDRIPIEILELIVKNIHTQSDLKNLCEVSKYVSKVTTQYLYESITFHADDTLDLDDLNHRLELFSSDNIKYTRRICIKAPLNYNLRKRCPHYDSNMPDHLADTLDMGSDSEDEVVDPFTNFGMTLNYLLEALKDDNLQSLSLDLGCCVPGEVLGDDIEFWIKNQKCIQSISLITDGGCPTFGHNEYLNLIPLTSLQSLCWKGLIRGDHFDSLKGFIKNQEGEEARKLRTLTLDLVEWSRADVAWYQHQQATLGGLPPRLDNFFATLILGIEPEQQTILFTALETLRLTGVAFNPFEMEFGYCFNMMNLSRLQLRNCPASLELLATILSEGIALKLKSFELAIDWECLHHYGDFDEAQTLVICRFLDSFKGLEDLFLLLTTPLEWYFIANSIANHRSTLKRLILHERHTIEGKIVDGGVPWHNSGEVLFYNSNLTCFGTSGSISKMESLFAELPTKPRCKILHIRMSWIDPHKEHEEEVSNQYDSDGDSDGDFDLLNMLDISDDQKFPSYPIAATVNELSNTTQTNPSDSPLSSELFGTQRLTSHELQISARRRNIANRSNFNGPAKDFLKFARWVFGPEGIPELRILALGDFSHDGRWGESNALLCRDYSISATGNNFRPMMGSDFEYWDLIDENIDMLSACSPDHLLWKELWA